MEGYNTKMEAAMAAEQAEREQATIREKVAAGDVPEKTMRAIRFESFKTGASVEWLIEFHLGENAFRLNRDGEVVFAIVEPYACLGK